MEELTEHLNDIIDAYEFEESGLSDFSKGRLDAYKNILRKVKNLTIPVVSVPKGTLCECGLIADGTLYNKPMCEGCLHKNT